MTYKIISGKYETGTHGQKATFVNMLGEDNTRYKFDLYFHWYNVIHELGHCLLDFYAVSMHNVEEEFWVNRFAIAYWKKVDAKGKLSELKKLLAQTLARLPSPVPEGQSCIEFFKSVWHSLWEKEEQEATFLYGYFQFSCVVEAMQYEDNLISLLQNIGINAVDGGAFLQYEGDIAAEFANDVLNICIENLEKLGVRTMKVSLELTDNPNEHCARKE